MKALLIICVAFAAISCTSCTDLIDHQPVYQIEPRVQSYVDKFFAEAASRGKALDKKNLIVVVTENINDPLLACAAGRMTFEGGQRYIYLWSGAFDYFVEHGQYAAAERLVFHELGHAFYRDHVDYTSIMNPYCPSDIYANNDSIRTALVNELISKVEN